MPPEPPQRRLQDYADWAIRLIVPALFSAAVAGIYWAANIDNRVANVEKFDGRIAGLEAKEDGYHALASDLAVVKAQLVAQDKQLDRIEKLLDAR